ncbi:cytochrome c [Candidatus Albibeggiatoa sp. nov. BB20]|uniref:c-type cytochrome n=1 Tax=Candidatus Albibeggiatoa sp. nov. BB20 TaxID=3162723 RepID=UPI0033659FD0
MRWLFLIGLFMNAVVYVQAAEISDGQKLHDKACLSCHDSMTNGKPEQIYTREDQVESSVEDLAGLKSRVQTCATNTGAQWFDDEVTQVVEYLNTTYYKFGLEESE